MAASTITVALTNVDNTQNLVHVFGTVAWSAGPDTYSTGGNTMSFAGFDKIKSNEVPLMVRVKSAPAAGSGAANEFVYTFLPGTTMANGKLQIFTGAAAQTALTELSAGAVPSGVSGDTIVFEAWFKRL